MPDARPVRDQGSRPCAVCGASTATPCDPPRCMSCVALRLYPDDEPVPVRLGCPKCKNGQGKYRSKHRTIPCPRCQPKPSPDAIVVKGRWYVPA